jgi:hypothetical protein
MRRRPSPTARFRSPAADSAPYSSPKHPAAQPKNVPPQLHPRTHRVRIESAGGDLGPTIRQAEKTLRDVSATTLSLEQQVVAISRDFGGAASATEEQLTAAVIELRRTVDSMNRVLDRMQDPRAALLGATPKQRGPGE